LIVSKQTKLALWFGSYNCWGESGTKKFCPGTQDTLATQLVRSAEECRFIRNATAAWRRLGGVRERMV